MIFRSPHQSLEIPPQSVHEFVLNRAGARGGRAALVDSVTGRTIAYSDLAACVNRVARGLARLGLKKGEACGVFSPNSIDYPIAVLAMLRLGAIVTTANPHDTADELAPQLCDAKARFLFISPVVQGVGLDAARRAGVERVIAFGTIEGATPFDELAVTSGPTPEVAIDPSEVAVLPYSSGTTGLAKGVMLTHRNLVANMLQLDGTGHLRDGEETLICFLPFFHIYGLVVVMLLGLWRGATLVVLPRFELEQYLHAHRTAPGHDAPRRPSGRSVALAKHPALEARDFSSVRKLFFRSSSARRRRHRAPAPRDSAATCNRVRPDGGEPGDAYDGRRSQRCARWVGRRAGSEHRILHRRSCDRQAARTL